MSVVATCGAPIGIDVRPSVDGTEHLFSGIKAADDLLFLDLRFWEGGDELDSLDSTQKLCEYRTLGYRVRFKIRFETANFIPHELETHCQ
jgi:hypothetical protein